MNHMMTPDAESHLRAWQKSFIKNKFCPKHVTGNEHNLWFANCCTGSGKSNVGFESVIQNILFNGARRKKSIHVFVGPSIMLSNQIKRECEAYLHKFYPFLVDKVEFFVRNCESTDSKIDLSKLIYWAKNSTYQHGVFTYCADSFFGNETIGNRYDAIYNGLKKTVTANPDIVCGTIVFDEAHNYKSRWGEITGYAATSSTNIIPTPEDINKLPDLFSDVLCMTGTPCPYQCWMSQDERWKKDSVVSVNYATAIKHKWIVCPDVYVIKVRDVKTQLEDAAITALAHERRINAANIRGVSNVATHMLINAPDINTANNCGKNLWNYYGGKVGSSILHSKATVKDTGRGMNTTFDLTAEIDGVKMGSKDAKESIMKIDTTDIGKERIVTQVKMISEGINVNSFDATLITSHSEVNITQQTGRTLRIFKGKNHASLYAVSQNQDDVAIIVSELVDQGLDLEEVLSHIKEIDISGRGKEEDPDSIVEYEKSGWRKYTKVEIKNLMNAVNGATVEARIRNYVKNNADAIDLIYQLISAIGTSSKASTTKGKSRTKSASKGKGSGASNASTGKKNEGMIGKKNAILRRIEDRITKVPDWRNLYIPNMDVDKIINYMLNDLCGIGKAPTLTKEQSAILRDLINQVDIEMQQAQAARTK